MAEPHQPARSWTARSAAGLILFAALATPLRSQQAGIRFEVRHLHTDANEGAAIADLNRDGRPDIVAGRNWYAAPEWTSRPLRSIADWNGYVESNGDHTLDVDGDGWVDVVAGSFNPTTVRWFRNPGKDGLEKGHLWKDSLLVDTGASQNELSFLRDLDGDGVPEWVVNSWQSNAPVYAWKLIRDAAGAPTMRRLTLSEVGNRHGMGFGDVNGDGREDVVLGGGWLERPASDPFGQRWRLRADWEPVQASTPMLVRDINGDGRADLVVGAGHAYGLRWWEQLSPGADGTTRWTRHDIDTTFSQVHALHWADLDGDGRDELITGKRKWAHGPTGDPGVNDPAVLLYFRWDPATRRFSRHTIAEGAVGTGLQIRTADMNGDGRVDVVVAGKSGTYLLINQGR